MLTLLPALILFLAAAAIAILQRVRPGFGYAWMVSTGAAIVAWGFTLALHWISPAPLVIHNWQQTPEIKHALQLELDSISWPYAFALATLALVFLLTLSARIRPDSDPAIWARSLGIMGLGFLSVLSVNPMTFAITWTAIDILELFTILGNSESPRQTSQAVIGFGARVIGTLALIWAMAVSRSSGSALALNIVSQPAGLFLVLAPGIRLGVLPLNIPFQGQLPLKRGIASILTITSAASSLAILARLPQTVVPSNWQPFLLLITVMAALYGAITWAAASDESAGRPYWIISMAAIAMGCVIQGQPQASLIWGLALILGGAMILLYSARSRQISWIPILMLVSISGLPYSLTASGWAGLLGSPLNNSGIFLLVAISITLLGYIRHWMHPGEPLAEKERWVFITYPLGLFMLIASAWIIPALNARSMLILGQWWVTPILLTLAALLFLVFYRLSWSQKRNPTHSWFVIPVRRVGSFLAIVFSFNWLYRFAWWLYSQVARLIHFVTILMEGDGGVLWVLVLLTLLIALINTRGGG